MFLYQIIINIGINYHAEIPQFYKNWLHWTTIENHHLRWTNDMADDVKLTQAGRDQQTLSWPRLTQIERMVFANMK